MDKNPIWQNQDKGVQIKRATVIGERDVKVLQYKKVLLGNENLKEYESAYTYWFCDYMKQLSNSYLEMWGWRIGWGSDYKEKRRFDYSKSKKSLGIRMHFSTP